MTLPSRRAGRLLTALMLLCLPVGVGLGQTPEVEPNDTCPTAQELGSPPLPLVVTGELPTDTSDIDFFRFIAPPGTLVQIDHMGVYGGGGTLDDPFLGVLDSACNVLAVDDDSGYGTDSKVFVVTPPDGVLVLAATSCCDWDLIGAGGSRGSYTITADVAHVVASIRARLVDAETGEALVGSWPTNARAELWRCHDSTCDEQLNTQWSDADGQVVFLADAWGLPLAPGDYEIRAFTEAHEPTGSGVFQALEGENVDLGDIMMQPYDLIASISGQVVDSISGVGLSGTTVPWATVQLARCTEWDCFNTVGWTTADPEGHFRFDYSNTWGPLLTGDYLLSAWADQYQTREVSVTAVAEDEERDVGRVRLRPFPVQFIDFTPCDEIPPTGGTCEYSVLVRAGTRTRLDAEAWSIVRVYDTGSFANMTTFQAGGNRSTVPVTERFKLAPGETKRLQFRFDVPGSLQQGAWICAEAYVGQRPDSKYSTLGFRDLFCVAKQWDSFAVVSEKEMHKRLHGSR
jgi:hypothetical protein